jgi:hypothetical protein
MESPDKKELVDKFVKLTTDIDTEVSDEPVITDEEENKSDGKEEASYKENKSRGKEEESDEEENKSDGKEEASYKENKSRGKEEDSDKENKSHGKEAYSVKNDFFLTEDFDQISKIMMDTFKKFNFDLTDVSTPVSSKPSDTYSKPTPVSSKPSDTYPKSTPAPSKPSDTYPKSTPAPSKPSDTYSKSTPVSSKPSENTFDFTSLLPLITQILTSYLSSNFNNQGSSGVTKTKYDSKKLFKSFDKLFDNSDTTNDKVSSILFLERLKKFHSDLFSELDKSYIKTNYYQTEPSAESIALKLYAEKLENEISNLANQLTK